MIDPVLDCSAFDLQLSGLWGQKREAALLCSSFPSVQELHVQLPQLFQEAPVGSDPPACFHLLDSVHQCHVLTDHEVGEEERGRATPSHHAVHQQFICAETRTK